MMEGKIEMNTERQMENEMENELGVGLMKGRCPRAIHLLKGGNLGHYTRDCYGRLRGILGV